ncbi:MAG: glutathione S-transferase family protein [Cyanobacteria bacterium K_Offshore_surface_m2_239]|nr:glutathione S-transferase family protein [Cyanobacteria bacterium K_Offshore_surface_m2_239]
MLELHQFRHSAFCEKVRLALAAKGLEATLVEVVPGVGQLELFRLSGQRQVPVLVDGGEVIADSTEIVLHLEQRHPLPPLLPNDPQDRARVLLLEDWADTALATGCRRALLQAAASRPALRAALLPESTPSSLRQLVSVLPGGLMGSLSDTLTSLLAPQEARQLRRNLEQLGQLVAGRDHLVGSQLTLADLAVVAQLSLLRFPASAGAALAGEGVDGIADNPLFQPLFDWRDRLLANLSRRGTP